MSTAGLSALPPAWAIMVAKSATANCAGVVLGVVRSLRLAVTAKIPAQRGCAPIESDRTMSAQTSDVSPRPLVKTTGRPAP